jgi:hypothetical protein
MGLAMAIDHAGGGIFARLRGAEDMPAGFAALRRDKSGPTRRVPEFDGPSIITQPRSGPNPQASRQLNDEISPLHPGRDAVSPMCFRMQTARDLTGQVAEIIGAPERMKLGTAMSLRDLCNFPDT